MEKKKPQESEVNKMKRLSMIFLAILLTGIETEIWNKLTPENQKEFVQMLGDQYFEKRPDCKELHIQAEEKDGITLFYGECTKRGA